MTRAELAALAKQIEPLIRKLREPVDEGGYDGFHPDPLHVSAAKVIEDLFLRAGDVRRAA